MKRILYVEDSVTSQKILQRMFSPPHEVITATTVRMALELLDRTAVDLIVSDYQLAQGDAFDLITPVRAKFPADTLPIIAVSGSMDQVLTARLLAAGSNACVCKPILNDAFRSLVQDMLDHPFVQEVPAGPVTTVCFQWVEHGQYHEYSPETGERLCGPDRTEVSARMLQRLKELRVAGQVLGQTTQERVRSYVLRETGGQPPADPSGP